uniref:Uncharacterized protein n=1 Tax=Musa acuminata subsp. malaccensis TaxID=214687 RepID=A0A804IZ14_MUSAM
MGNVVGHLRVRAVVGVDLVQRSSSSSSGRSEKE